MLLVKVFFRVVACDSEILQRSTEKLSRGKHDDAVTSLFLFLASGKRMCGRKVGR